MTEGFPKKPKRPKTGGRQKGTPNKTTAEMRELARRHGPEALASIVVLMNLSQSDQIRLAAARELLDRGYGKPAQSMEVITIGADPDPGPRTREEYMAKYGMDEAGYEKLRAVLNELY